MLMKIKTIIVDQTEMLIYAPDGSEPVRIPQGDPRLRRIMDAAMPALLANEIAEVEVGDDNHFQQFEEQTGGIVKLFRVAKSKLKDLFGVKPAQPVQTVQDAFVPPMTVSATPQIQQVPTTQPVPVAAPPINPNLLNQSSPSAEQAARDILLNSLPPEKVEAPRAVEANPAMAAPYGEKPVLKEVPKPNHILNDAEKDQRRKAVEDVMKHATPVKSGSFTTNNLDHADPDTLVAVVENPKTKEKVLVQDVQHMANHMAHAVKTNSHEGLVRFMERVGAVASKRQHSVDDLLKFMKRNDMPIANDGSILAYKTLQKHKETEGLFVDIHSKRVPQKVGTRVFMSEKLVDPDRRNACSNGLHIARRGYVGGFRGDACFLIRIDPEDVIAVPEYDANKMRVSGYDIIHQLSDQDYAAVCADRAFTDNSTSKQVLADMVAGKYPEIHTTVEITAHMGGGLKITSLEPKKTKKAEKPVTTPVNDIKEETVTETNNVPAAAPAEAEAVDFLVEGKMTAPVLNMDQVQDAIVAHKNELKGNALAASQLYDAVLAAKSGSAEELHAAEALLDFKKAKKKGWPALGLHSDVADELNAIVNKDAKPE